MNHHFLDLVRRRIRPHLRNAKAEVRCWERLRKFRKEVWFMVMAGYSPSFIREFFITEFSQLFPTISWEGVKGSVIKVSELARSGRLMVDDECRELLEDYEAGPWAPNAPDWLKEQYGVNSPEMISLAPDSVSEAGRFSTGNAKLSPAPLGAGSKKEVAPAPAEGASATPGRNEEIATSSPGLGPVPPVSLIAPGTQGGNTQGEVAQTSPGGLAPAPVVSVVSAFAPGMGETERVESFLKSWEMVKRYDPSAAPLTMEEIVLGSTGGLSAVVALRSSRIDVVRGSAASVSSPSIPVVSVVKAPTEEPGLVPVPVLEKEPVSVFAPVVVLEEKVPTPPVGGVVEKETLGSIFGVDPMIRPMGEPVSSSPMDPEDSLVVSGGDEEISPDGPVGIPLGDLDEDFVVEGFEFLDRKGSGLGSLEDELRASGVTGLTSPGEDSPDGGSESRECAMVVFYEEGLGKFFVELELISEEVAAEMGIYLFSKQELRDLEVAREYFLSHPELFSSTVPVLDKVEPANPTKEVPEGSTDGLGIDFSPGWEPDESPVEVISNVEVVSSVPVLGREIRELPWEVMQRGLDQGLNLEGHQNFFPELTGKTLEEVYASWEAEPAPDGYRKYELDRHLVETGLRAGKTFRDLYRTVPGAVETLSGQTTLFLFMEAMVEHAFGLRTDRVTAAGEPVLHYGACWNVETAREMKERGVQDWFYPMNPMRIQSRKPATRADVPRGYFWVDFWGLFPDTIRDRMEAMKGKNIQACLESALLPDGKGTLQKDETEFYVALFNAVGRQAKSSRGKRSIDPFIYCEPAQFQSVGNLPKGASFMGLPKALGSWMDLSTRQNLFWGFDSMGDFEPLGDEMNKIHTKFYRPSLDRLDKALFSQVNAYRSAIVRDE